MKGDLPAQAIGACEWSYGTTYQNVCLNKMEDCYGTISQFTESDEIFFQTKDVISPSKL
jgi:hypothetical protein